MTEEGKRIRKVWDDYINKQKCEVCGKKATGGILTVFPQHFYCDEHFPFKTMFDDISKEQENDLF